MLTWHGVGHLEGQGGNCKDLRVKRYEQKSAGLLQLQTLMLAL